MGSLQFMDNEEQNNHTVFVNDEDDVNTWEPETYFDTTSELLDRKYNRLSEKQLEEQEFVTSLADESELSKMKKRREERYKNLAEALDDQETIDRVLSHIELRKNLSGKGKRIKVKEGENGHADIYPQHAAGSGHRRGAGGQHDKPAHRADHLLCAGFHPYCAFVGAYGGRNGIRRGGARLRHP